MKESKRDTFVACVCGDGRVMPLFYSGLITDQRSMEKTKMVDLYCWTEEWQEWD
jgi:hypothetical protein